MTLPARCGEGCLLSGLGGAASAYLLAPRRKFLGVYGFVCDYVFDWGVASGESVSRARD